jgi:hypothetical protein
MSANNINYYAFRIHKLSKIQKYSTEKWHKEYLQKEINKLLKEYNKLAKGKIRYDGTVI